MAVRGNYLHVVMTIKRLEGCECFGDFHCLFTALSLFRLRAHAGNLFVFPWANMGSSKAQSVPDVPLFCRVPL
jgi:hypothetical protein